MARDATKNLVSPVVPMDPHMQPSDAFSWYMERDPLLRSTVVAVGLLDRRPDADALRTLIERASFVVPGMRHVVRTPPFRLATPRWTVADEVDLNWHLRWASVPAPGGFDQVLAIARTKSTSAFDPARPLWEFTFVDGLAAGRAAFILKFHHAITDGIGGMQLAMELFDLNRNGNGPRPAPAHPAAESLGTPQLALDALSYQVGRALGLARALPGVALRTTAQTMRDPFGTIAGVLRATRSVARTVAPYRNTLSPVMQDRHLGRALDVLEVPTKDLMRAGSAVGAHLNDAFVSAVTGGMRRYHESHGRTVDELRVTMPISLRTASDGPGGNRLTLSRFAIPAGLPDAAERTQAIHRVIDGWRAEPSLGMTQAIAVGLNMLPSAFIGGMLKHVDFLASNVPGFPVPVYLAGARLLAYYPFGPTIGSSVNVTLLSYVDTCYVGINCDTGAIPDPDVFVECLREGFAEVIAVGGGAGPVRLPLHDPAPVRRRPAGKAAGDLPRKARAREPRA